MWDVFGNIALKFHNMSRISGRLHGVFFHSGIELSPVNRAEISDLASIQKSYTLFL